MPIVQPDWKYDIKEDDEVERQREIDGVTVEAKNPFGFWYITDKRFSDHHDEAFTTLSALESRIKQLKAEGNVSAKASIRSGRKQLLEGVGDGGVGT